MRTRLTISVLLLVFFQFCFAPLAKGQNIADEKVTLGLKDESLVSAIKKIEQQSVFRFFYRSSQVEKFNHLNLPAATRTIKQTLDLLLQNTPLTYRQVDGNILLEYKARQVSYTVSGRVLSQPNKIPIENASVFLSNATIGDKTENDGTFTLQGVKPGKYSFVVSIVGFETITETLNVDSDNVVLPDIALLPKTVILSEVKIKPANDPNRDKYYDWFKNEFLGTSELASQCKIANPEVLNLDYDSSTNTLTASSNGYLEIRNEALGYNIRYLLTHFEMDNRSVTDKKIHYEGSVFFEEMKGSASQQKRWQRLRQEAYEGSAMNFLQSVVDNRMNQEGFRALRLRRYANPNRPSDSLVNAKIKYYEQLKPQSNGRSDSLAFWNEKAKLPKIIEDLMPYHLHRDDILKPTDQPGLFALGFGGDGSALYITFNKAHHFYPDSRPVHLYDSLNKENTRINFNAPYAMLDRNGAVMNPNSLTFIGVWGRKRLADLLPINYEPAENQASFDRRDSVNDIAGNLSNRTEKTYLQLNGTSYAPGDTVYFKAYITNGESHRLSILNGILHIELAGADNKVYKSVRLRVDSGLTWGSLDIPASLPKGTYQLRACTHDENGAGLFRKDISVGMVRDAVIPERLTRTAAEANAEDAIHFFPEGGSLVNGVRSKVAFKALDANGVGIAVNGTVMDNDNNVVATFAPAHLGMGCFYFTPQEGKTYRAKLVYADGTQSLVNLPRIVNSGLVLSVNNDSIPKTTFTITANSTFYQQNKDQDYMLLVYSGGVVTSIICRLDNPVITTDILKRHRQTGISTATLFSPDGEPLCRRLFFVQNYDQLTLDISSDKTIYAKGEKINLKLNAINRAGNPVKGHFSVSVTHENKLRPENYDNTIVSDMLLTSGMKDDVEQPGYYFSDTTSTALKYLDILMLTRGYHCYSMKPPADDSNQAIDSRRETEPESQNVFYFAKYESSSINRPATAPSEIYWKPELVTSADGNASFEYNNPDVAGIYRVVVEGIDDKGCIGRQVYRYRVE